MRRSSTCCARRSEGAGAARWLMLPDRLRRPSLEPRPCRPTASYLALPAAYPGAILVIQHAELLPLARLLVHIHAAAAECVHVTPAAGDVEQLEQADPLRQRRVDHQMLADRLETEHGAQQQERRPGGPRLGAARRGVLHRVLGDRPR